MQDPTTPKPSNATRATSAADDARPVSRSSTLIVGAAATVALALAVVRAPRHAHSNAVVSPAANVDPPGAASASASAQEKLAEALAELEKLPMGDKPGAKRIMEALENVGPSNVGRTLPNGSLPPPLPPDAPREVRFGVILVRYQGAQLAPANAMTRADALARAERIALRARADFPGAMAEGDRGSTSDVGSVRRGVLEAGIEYQVFTLPVGWTTGPIDTPRGFWIVRRNR